MTLPSAYVSAVMADTPWALWGMQETSGTTMGDLSGNAHGGLYDAAVVSTTGPYSGWTAAHFTGTTAWVSGVISLSTAIAVEWWSKLTSNANPQCIMVDYVNSANTQGFEAGAMKVATCGPNLSFATNAPSMGWVCSAHPATDPGTWQHCVLQLEADGHWRLYINIVSGGGSVTDDLGAHSMTAPSSPNLYIGRRPDTTLPYLGDIAAVALYDHPLTSTRIRAHFDAAAGPPPPPCQYGTRPKPGTPSVTDVTDAFLQSLLAFFPSFPVGQAFANTIGMHINTAAVCNSPPPTLAPFQWTDLFTLGARALTQLEIMAWWVLCECVPGTPTPVTPTPPTPVLQPGYPSDPVYVVNPTNPCLDLTEVRRKLDELIRLVNDDLGLDHFVQRQLVPSATASGTPHLGLSGAGSIAISAAIGAQIVITARPPGGRELEGAPPYIWDAGWLSIMDGNGFIQERRLTRDVEVWMPRLMSDAITFGYYLKDGVVADITILYALP